jgi:poly(rC)-binding protein 3/4
MKIPLPHAEEIIGARGENIEFIRSASGAVVILEEIGDYPEEVLVMIKGSPSQVQTAYQVLQVTYILYIPLAFWSCTWLLS